MDGLHRSERCIPLSGSEDRIQEVPPFCLGRTDIRVLVPSIRIEQCTEGIHQALEASSGSPQASRNSPCYFLGRHANAGSGEGRSDGLDGPDNPVVQSVGVLSQPGEVTVDFSTADSISGVFDRLSEFEDPAHTVATDRNLQGHHTAGEFNSARHSQAYWENDSYLPSNSPGPLKVPEPAETEDPSCAGHSRTRPQLSWIWIPKGVRLVDNFSDLPEWEEYFE